MRPLSNPLLPFVAFTRSRLLARDTASLLALVAAGDTDALAEVYRRESAAVYRYALVVCGGDAESAADATQESFVAFAARPLAYDPARGTLGAYLAGIARHAIGAQRRRRGRERPLAAAGVDLDLDADADGDEPLGSADAGADPEALLVRAQGSEQLWAAMRRLPAPMREALVLVDLQERPYGEAAQIAGIEINTLKTRVHRARLKLAALLDAGSGASDGSRR